METIRSLIWYAVLLALLITIYKIGTSYTVVIVDERFSWMDPTVQAGTTHLLNQSRDTILSVDTDDIIAYEVYDRDKVKRLFGRVLARPNSTVTVRGKRLLVDGAEVADAPKGLAILSTGLIVPKDRVFVVFDSAKAGAVPLAERLVPYRNILGRITSQ